MMLAAKLRHRVNLESATLTRDAWGGIIETWGVVASQLPADITILSGRELLSAQALQSGITARITLRYRNDITPTMRVIHNNKIYSIQSIIPDPTLSRTIALFCEEGVKDG